MEKKNCKTILICSIHPVYRDTLAQAILSVSSLGTVRNIIQANDLLEREKIDCLLVNLDRTSINPFEFIQSTIRKFPYTKLIILTFWDHINYNNNLLKSGASFYYVIGQKLEILIRKLDTDIFENNNTNTTNTLKLG